MRVALVYDRLNKLGGAEAVLAAFIKLFPDVSIYTSVWDPKRAPFSASWRVVPSFLNYLPFLRSRHELVPFLMPFAFESFDFSGFDLLISVGSAECKGIVTRADTLHLHYCLTPTRYLWSHQSLYLDKPQFGWLQRLARPLVKRLLAGLASWDLVAATRPDHMISISEQVKRRVQKYYKRDSVVIYPPVDTNKFVGSSVGKLGSYYLTVSRLVPYKNVDILIQAFNGTARRLVVVGVGSELDRLKRLAGDNITFLGAVADPQLVRYYQGCLAFVHAGTEDFGIAMAEAQAAGKPVIAYQKGGAGEIVEDGVTGLLVPSATAKAFRQALDGFETMKFSADKCRQRADRFDESVWQGQIKKYIEQKYEQHQKH